MVNLSTWLFIGIVALAGWGGTRELIEQYGGAFLPADDMVAIEGGSYTPVFPLTKAESVVPVRAFWLDRRPVTNARFLAFVREHPKWRRDNVRPVVAESGYLSQWERADRVGPGVDLQAPVVRVSWFAARAFCETRGGRLPMEAEWEYVGSASEDSLDGRKDPAWAAHILEWYGRLQTSSPGRVGRQKPNAFGVEDMHGLVWEWVLDWNSTLVSGDAREGGAGDRMTFCGAGALAAVDRGDYATFMRVAMRSSLAAGYVAPSLGFRCARDGGVR